MIQTSSQESAVGDRWSEVILIEFNELVPALLDRFMNEGCLPNFSRFHSQSHVYTTDAQENPPVLEPWIQWLTVHSGMNYDQHKVFHLGDGRNLAQSCLATLLSDAGYRVGVFGSMNTNYGRLNGYFMPDPWDKAGQPSPAWLTPYFTAVATQVQESTRDETVGKNQLVALGWFLAKNGLRPATAWDVLRQLAGEWKDKGVRWRRAMLLEALQYDVFRSLNRRFRAQFSTFFANSTAHFQHYFWRDMAPEEFDTPVPKDNHPSLAGAIREGYIAMDRLLGRFMADSPKALLIMATGLSQQPWTDTTKCTFRPKDFGEFLKLVGIDPTSCKLKPVMAEQFHLDFPTEAEADQALDKLQALRLGDRELMYVSQNKSSLFAGCKIFDASAKGREFSLADGTSRPFDDVFYMLGTLRSGRHHPDGCLWFRTGEHHLHPGKVDLVSIAPTILSLFGVPAPLHMRGHILDVAGGFSDKPPAISPPVPEVVEA